MEKAFLKISEVAEVIGLGKSMVYKLISDGHIPSVRLAGVKARRVSRKALEAWILEQESSIQVDVSWRVDAGGEG